MSALDAAGPQAAQIEWLWWAMLYTLGAVFVVVMLVLLAAVVRSRGSTDSRTSILRPVDAIQERRLAWMVLSGVVATTLILFALLLLSFHTGRELFAMSQSDQPFTITVTGHQWWWHVEYSDVLPSRIVTTANEIHIPLGRPVMFRLKSSDVIHSFWAPNLNGKTDLIPGHEATTWLRADRAGRYNGQCAEFCGHQHAHMAFSIVAEPEAQFNEWYEQQLEPSAEPSTPEQLHGREVFLTSTCVSCHRIQGTIAGGTNGPDLTHIASRTTIAAGTLTNTRNHLLQWVENAQSVKPGNHMPRNTLEPGDLQALIDYLQSLK